MRFIFLVSVPTVAKRTSRLKGLPPKEKPTVFLARTGLKLLEDKESRARDGTTPR